MFLKYETVMLFISGDYQGEIFSSSLATSCWNIHEEKNKHDEN